MKSETRKTPKGKTIKTTSVPEQLNEGDESNESGALGAFAVILGAAGLVVGGKMLYDHFSKPSGGGGTASDRPQEGGRPKAPKPWSRGPGGKGKVFGGGKGKPGEGPPLPEDLPDDFDYAGNGLYVDPNCEYVIEGNIFWPGTTGPIYASAEATTLDSSLALFGGKNSILGFVDYLVNEQSLGDDPEGIAWTVLEHASPMCTSVEPEGNWGDGLINWYDNFLERIIAYLDEGIGSEGQQVFVSESEVA